MSIIVPHWLDGIIANATILPSHSNFQGNLWAIINTDSYIETTLFSVYYY